MSSPPEQIAVPVWMGEVDPSQIGFPFAPDRSRYRKQTGVLYKETEHGPLHLDVYSPSGAEEPAPLVVMIHGGGWQGGGRFEMGLSKWAGYLASAGMVVASIDYRLSGQASFPHSFQDCLDAIDWLVERAPELGADADRIGLWGDSAGGHLVLLVAASQTHPGYTGPRMKTPGEQIAGVVSWYPPTDLRSLYALESSSGSVVVSSFVGASPEEDPDRWQQVSPIDHVHAALPPTLILQGTRDMLVPHDQATRYAERLEACGAPHELHIVEGAVHGFDRVAPNAHAKSLIERSRAFLMSELGVSSED